MKRKWKGFLVVFAVVLVVLIILTGCGKKSTEPAVKVTSGTKKIPVYTELFYSDGEFLTPFNQHLEEVKEKIPVITYQPGVSMVIPKGFSCWGIEVYNLAGEQTGDLVDLSGLSQINGGEYYFGAYVVEEREEETQEYKGYNCVFHMTIPDLDPLLTVVSGGEETGAPRFWLGGMFWSESEYGSGWMCADGSGIYENWEKISMSLPEVRMSDGLSFRCGENIILNRGISIYDKNLLRVKTIETPEELKHLKKGTYYVVTTVTRKDTEIHEGETGYQGYHCGFKLVVHEDTALAMAADYCEKMPLSKAALLQLLSSKFGDCFTEAEIQYAVNQVAVDWNESALVKAQEYCDTMYMSRAAIYDSLISDENLFTKEETGYALQHLEADWKQNALVKAHIYSKKQHLTKDEIYDRLISDEGDRFTEAETIYAIYTMDLKCEENMCAINLALTGVPYMAENDYIDDWVPYSVSFDSVDELISFVRAGELSDMDLESYLYDNNSGRYDMNGIENRADLRAILAWLDGMPVPLSEEYSLLSITVYPEREEVYMLYENKDGKRCSFNMNMGAGITSDDCLRERNYDNKCSEELVLPSKYAAERAFYLDRYVSPNLYANPAYYFLVDYGTCYAGFKTVGITDYDQARDILWSFMYLNISKV
ncbi:MAG: Ltp family lipoprotein [Oscillospiraceae bacterium]|nr:Ltp family lipoprotein [Oscillospiraceae bacterium]